jgi:thiamine-phosphate pyrophosphorylase
MDAAMRILDANLNRAREGLRVLEDVARFALGRQDVCARIKELRHMVAGAGGAGGAGGVGGVGGGVDALRLLASRDTPGDVGTSVTTAGEAHRASLGEVATAAAKRTQEALRSCEESAKALGLSAAASGFEGARYEAYELERLVVTAMGNWGARRQFALCVLITQAMCGGRDWREVAAEAAKGGADCLQLREKPGTEGLEDGELLARAREFVQIAHAHGAAAFINDRADIAMLAGADGVHLGQSDLPIAAVRELVGARLLVGVSTENLDQARAAVRAGADLCGVGPMFSTTTKHKERIVGAEYLRAYLGDEECGRVAHLAIGGITPERASELARAGCRGVAVSSYVCGSDDPRAAAARLREAIGSRAEKRE